MVRGGTIPYNFMPAVEKGVREVLGTGFLAGFPLQDLRVTVYDGKYHDVDSSEMSFKIAGSLAFKDGRLRHVLGCMGADGQPQIHVQAYVAMIDFGLDIQQAVAAPRWL